MAFTAENSHDAYLFFVLAFGAAPGKEFGGQIYQAYDAGATTQQIVNTYATKPQFKDMYPDTQTSAEFAAALIKNVVGNTASDTAKDQAVADIVAAMGNGLGKGDVIYAILGNLSKMDTANADWGKTVAMLNNKIAVAKALTEGGKALNTTDLALLQDPLKGVTEDFDTVQKAIDAAGSLTDKLEVLAAANKAKADFAAALDLNGDGKADGWTAANVQAEVDADVAAKGALVDAKVVGYSTAPTEAQKAALLAVVKANNDAAVADKQADLVLKNKAVADLGVTAAQVSQYKALAANVTATDKADAAAAAVEAGKLAELNTLEGAALTVAGNGEVTNYIVADAAGKLSLDTTGTTKVTDANKAVVTALLNSIVAAQAAAANKDAAAAAKLQFDNALGGAKTAAIDAAIAAEGAVATAQKANVDLDKLVAAYAASKANDTKLVVLDKAIADANKAFTDAGLPVPKEVDAGLFATAGDDTYIIGAHKVGDISGFGLLGKDAIYVGKGYELNTTGDLTKGNDAKLEVFFKTTATGTDVYVEQKVFGSSEATHADLVQISLTGVAADKLVFKDGMITVVA